MGTLPQIPTVSILCPDLSSNALGRSLLLARLLEGHTEVEILGVSSRPGLWPPARATSIKIRPGPLVQGPGDLLAARRWLQRQSQELLEVLLVSKPLPTSLGLAMELQLGSRQLVLDVDDWEYGLCFPDAAKGLKDKLKNALAVLGGALRPRRANHPLAIRSCENLVTRIPKRLVANTWLRERFGGTLLYHVRDPDELDPAKTEASHNSELRRELRLEARPWVGFVGTPRPHKGLDDLVAALGGLQSETAPGLLLMGAEASNPYDQAIIRLASDSLGQERLRVLGPFPLEQLARNYMAADIIAIPSKLGPASQGQVPAKLFDAMSMARPIVATAVGDCPRVLGDSGLIVPARDVPALQQALASLAADPGRRAELGARARERLLEHYSFAAGRHTLFPFLQEMVA